MTDLIPNLIEIFEIFFLVGFFCCSPISVIGMLIYSAYINLTQNRLAHQKLAQALGYTQLNQANHILKTWFGGTHQGRRIAISTYGSTYRYYSDGRSRTGVRFTLRIAMEVQTTEIPGLVITRKRQKGIPQTFADAFETQNAGYLSRAARETMLAFIYKGHPTGFKKDLTVRFTPGTRDLTYRDRAGIKGLTCEVLPSARMLLIHDHPDAGLSSEKFRALLDEMSAVAQSIETGTVPQLLANQITPPVENPGKYAPWLLGGFMIFGLPAIACVCAMANSFLDS